MQGPFEQGEELISQIQTQPFRPLQLDVTIVMETSRDTQQLLQSLVRGHEQLPGRIASEMETRGLKEDMYDLSVSLCFYRDISMDPEAIRMCSLQESEKLQRYADDVSENTANRLSGLEALYCAMCSRPRPKKGMRQQYILVYALSPAYPLENPMNRIDPEYLPLLKRNVLPYSPEIPRHLEGLRDLWERPGETQLDPFHSTLVVCAPPAEGWMEIGQWNRAVFRQAHDIRTLCRAFDVMPAALAERVTVDLLYRLD